MEVLGLVIGIAGLYSTCLEAVNKVKSYKAHDFESSYTIARFNVYELRLRRWADDVGIADNKLKDKHHDKLDDPEINAATSQILCIIREIFSNTQDMSLRLQNGFNDNIGPLSVTSPKFSDNNNISLSTKAKPFVRRRDRVKWTFGGGANFIDQVNMFEKLVDALYILIHPKNQNWSSGFNPNEPPDQTKMLQRRTFPPCSLVRWCRALNFR